MVEYFAADNTRVSAETFVYIAADNDRVREDYFLVLTKNTERRIVADLRQ